MAPPDLLDILIVCHDDRALQLARVIGPIGRAYRCELENGESVYSQFNNDRWDPPSVVPGEFDALFFHVGWGDPGNVPNDCTFKVEFAFSADGVRPGGTPGGRVNAIPIQRQFVINACPIKSGDLPQLKAFIASPSDAAPRFCILKLRGLALSSLAILCQAYAAAGIARNEIDANSEIGEAVGWARLSTDAVSSLSHRLKGQWKAMQTTEWWRRGLGLRNEASERQFAARVVEDMDMDAKARTALGQHADSELSELPTEQLIDVVGTNPGAGRLVELLRVIVLGRSSIVSVSIVEAAYNDIKILLEG